MIDDDDDYAKAILRGVAPALRDILWCALVWNDHNFTYQDLLNTAARAAKTLGLDRYNGVAAVNEWMRQVDECLAKGAEHASDLP